MIESGTLVKTQRYGKGEVCGIMHFSKMMVPMYKIRFFKDGLDYYLWLFEEEFQVVEPDA